MNKLATVLRVTTVARRSKGGSEGSAAHHRVRHFGERGTPQRQQSGWGEGTEGQGVAKGFSARVSRFTRVTRVFNRFTYLPGNYCTRRCCPRAPFNFRWIVRPWPYGTETFNLKINLWNDGRLIIRFVASNDYLCMNNLCDVFLREIEPSRSIELEAFSRSTVRGSLENMSGIIATRRRNTGAFSRVRYDSFNRKETIFYKDTLGRKRP